MVKKLTRCIYCGLREGSTRDHVPPKCMFLSPMPNDIQMITVPCCEECRSRHQGDDAIARNFLISSAVAESRQISDDRIEGKRNRSLERDRRLLKQMTNAITLADVSSGGKVSLGTAAAFNLDQPAMNRFFDRVARALLHEEIGSGHIACTIKWKPVMDSRFNYGFSKYATQARSIGNIFSYAGHKKRSSDTWYWFLNFFGQDFLVVQTIQDKQEERR
jgi:hypothetical protein